MLEPKDLLESHNYEDLYIQLKCGGGRLSRRDKSKRMFKVKYVFDCVRKGRLLPNLSEYLCKQYLDLEQENTSRKQNAEPRDPLEVFYLLLLNIGFYLFFFSDASWTATDNKSFRKCSKRATSWRVSVSTHTMHLRL